MGIFGGGYTKPGKGVEKNERKKKGLFLYFEILVQKFTKFLGLNCLYAMTSIIWIILLMLFAKLVFTYTGVIYRISTETLEMVNNAAAASGGEMANPETVFASVTLMLQLVFATGVFVLWGSGPASAAYAYVNRCFTRAEPVFVLSDAVDKFKENFKQGMIVVLIDAVMLMFGIFAMYFYYRLYHETGNMLFLILTYFLIIVFMIYTMMHPYIYQIMVTFECKIGALYKNALLMALGKAPLNLVVNAISVGVIFLAFWSISNPIVAVLLLLIFGLCISRYPTEFYAARVIERSILRDMKPRTEIEYIEEEQ